MSDYRDWYKSYRWKQTRLRQLRREPLCAWCHNSGTIKEATIAHHVIPHRGDPELFWRGELISLCKEHHDIDAQRIENGGEGRHTVGLDGWPIPLDTRNAKY